MRALALVLACLLLPVASFGLVRSRAHMSRSFDTREIPARLGDFQLAREAELPADVRAMIAPDAYSLRLYETPASAPVWLYVAFYSGAGASGAHDPNVCYPAQGWDVVGLRERALALQDGESLRVRGLAATRGPSEELVLYWFQPAERWPASARFEPFLRALDGLAGRSRYAFVRLSTRVSTHTPRDVSAAESALAALAREVAPAVRAVVKGRGP
jgi:EpsI family protein